MLLILCVMILSVCVQMAGLCWMAVVLAVFLSAENSLAAVDQNRLAAFVDGVLSK